MATQLETQPQVQVANESRTRRLVSLYVGDIDKSVADAQLLDLFRQIGEVSSLRICRDSTGMSLGYGYVNYRNRWNAERALEELNFIPLNGKPIRVMYSNRDPTARRSNNANIFIKNLDKEIDSSELYETFSTFGNILSCKVATDHSGQSKGYGYVQYESAESARLAIEKLNGELLNGKRVYVGPLVRKEEREMAANRSTFTNVFVKNLSESVAEDDLKTIFGEFGSITSTVVMKKGDGTSKCFGFVNFENPNDAAIAVETLDGKVFDGKAWFVGKALKKSERELELRRQSEQAAEDSASNLYVKNLDDSIDDDKLKDLFSPFGSVTSCKVTRDPNGISKGSGFVAFSSPQDASQALFEMNGKLVVNKRLYVAFAERKEDRRARLQAQFAQMRPICAPDAQQIFYGQPPPAIISQPSGGPPIPNMFRPMVQQGPIQRNNSGQMQQPQMLHGRGIHNMGGSSPAMSQPMPIGALASALANSPANEQKTMLGENLYPLVERLEPENAAKVTGMLLEMDQPEILHLMESPEALEAKVNEAMEVLLLKTV